MKQALRYLSAITFGSFIIFTNQTVASTLIYKHDEMGRIVEIVYQPATSTSSDLSRGNAQRNTAKAKTAPSPSRRLDPAFKKQEKSSHRDTTP